MDKYVSEDIEWRSRNLQVAMKGILGKNERGKIKGYHLNLTVLFIHPPRPTPPLLKRYIITGP